MTDTSEPDRADDATAGSEPVEDETLEMEPVADTTAEIEPIEDATVEMEPVADTTAVIEPVEDLSTESPVPGRAAASAPLWMVLAMATIAVVALGVALAAFTSARQARDTLATFQDEVLTSGEEAAATLSATSAGLATLVEQPVTFTARVNQDVPIVASVPFQRTIEVPIRTAIPINEVIETTITVDGPFGFDVPVDVTVPLDLTIPVDITVPIQIDEAIDVDTSTRLDLDVPVELDLEESGLADLVRLISANLERLAGTIPTPR